MKSKIFSIILIFIVSFVSSVNAQKITYAEPERDDVRSLNFEIMGKFNGNFLIYKYARNTHYVAVYDNNMTIIEKNKLDFVPDKIINADFVAYPDFSYMFYQYQKRNVVYCMGVKLDAKGKVMGEPIEMDTTEIGFLASNKIFNVIYSENKQKILAYKVNSKSDKNHIVTAVLFDKDLKQTAKTRSVVPMPDRSDFLTEFVIDNEGNLAFIRAVGSAQNDNIGKLTLLTKNATESNLMYYQLAVDKIYLDDVRLKVDNINKHYIILSYYSKQRNGNIDGIYCFVWDWATSNAIATTATGFNDEMRADARGENSMKMAFNDYYLGNIILRKDGGYIVSSESVYTSTRNNNSMNRWGYLRGAGFWSPADYYSFSPYTTYPGWMWSRNNSFNQLTRYYADNVAVMSFDKTGKMEWANFIRKSQYDDYSDNLLGYNMMNAGGELYFLYNQVEKRTQLLTAHIIDPDGKVTRNPTFKNLDKGHDFMPRFGKQVGARQMIMPSEYRNNICFAKIDF